MLSPSSFQFYAIALSLSYFLTLDGEQNRLTTLLVLTPLLLPAFCPTLSLPTVPRPSSTVPLVVLRSLRALLVATQVFLWAPFSPSRANTSTDPTFPSASTVCHGARLRLKPLRPVVPACAPKSPATPLVMVRSMTYEDVL